MRCKDCKRYEQFPDIKDIDFGWCKKIGDYNPENGGAWVSGCEDFFVSADFGCIHFEAITDA